MRWPSVDFCELSFLSSISFWIALSVVEQPELTPSALLVGSLNPAVPRRRRPSSGSGSMLSKINPPKRLSVRD